VNMYWVAVDFLAVVFGRLTVANGESNTFESISQVMDGLALVSSG